jgi:hypothetical protein
MSDEQAQPGELTERFVAFSQSVDPAPSKALPYALIAIGAAIVVGIVVMLVLVFAG